MTRILVMVTYLFAPSTLERVCFGLLFLCSEGCREVLPLDLLIGGFLFLTRSLWRMVFMQYGAAAGTVETHCGQVFGTYVRALLLALISNLLIFRS
jgi:hypothetical protein